MEEWSRRATDLQEKIIAFKDDELSDKALNYLKGV